MKKSLLLLSVLFIFLSSHVFGQAGALDNSFGKNGITITPVTNYTNQVWGMVQQTDQKLVVGGFAWNGRNLDFALSRYNSNGILDSTYGNNGLVLTAMTDSNDLIFGLALQPDGKVIAAGFGWQDGNYEFAMSRYKTDGSIDNSFGTNGKVLTDMGPGDDKVFSIAVMNDWSIVLGGSSFNGQDNDFAIAKYTRDGSLDTSFNHTGKLVKNIGTGDDVIYSVKIQNDWSIVVGGASFNNGYDNFGLLRVDTFGVADAQFGTNGVVTTPVGNTNSTAYSLVIQPDNKIVAAGRAGNGTANDFALVRYGTNGALDNTFSTTGKAIIPADDSVDALYAVTLQPDGKIVAAGTAYTGTKQNSSLIRINMDGTADLTFNNTGEVTTQFSANDNEDYCVMIQPDGKIVTSGYANDSTHDNFSIARYISGLTLGILNFDGANSVLIYPNPIPQDATLEYTLKNGEELSIYLVDMQGKRVTTFLDHSKQAEGDYKQPIMLPQGLASGSYMVVLESNSGTISVKVVK